MQSEACLSIVDAKVSKQANEQATTNQCIEESVRPFPPSIFCTSPLQEYCEYCTLKLTGGPQSFPSDVSITAVETAQPMVYVIVLDFTVSNSIIWWNDFAVLLGTRHDSSWASMSLKMSRRVIFNFSQRGERPTASGIFLVL